MKGEAQTFLDRLLSISSPSIEAVLLHSLPSGMDRALGARGRELTDLLRRRNGFYAFEGALHVFPTHASSGSVELVRWNESQGWRRPYGAAIAECVFFAQDIFAHQFCIDADAVWSFDPESGTKQRLGDSVDDWARAVLEDYNVLTGYPIAHQWQSIHGALPLGARLAPKTPFILGGEFSVDNLFALDAAKCMEYLAEIYNQTKHLPSGSVVRLTTEP